MSLREFTDGTGMRWRVWDVTPAQVHPRSSDERLFIGYEQGWLAFESIGGELRRRLCPCPVRWQDASPAELERLLGEAEPVRARPHRVGDSEPEPPAPAHHPTNDAADVARLSVELRELEEPDATRKRPLRTFQFPGGRIWTAGLLTSHDEATGKSREVLRFVSGAHRVELEQWPDDWERYSDQQLADLLRSGAPPREEHEDRGLHRRREDRKG
jgi:hypothetical protein